MSRTLASLAALLLAVTSFAQDGKPTKEQTIQYIETNYPTRIEYFASASNQTSDSYHSEFNSGEVSDLEFTVSGTRATFTFHDVLVHKQHLIFATDGDPLIDDQEKEVANNTIQVAFDLKDIEEIIVGNTDHVYSLNYAKADEDSLFPLYLVFNAAGGKQAITITVNGVAKQSTNAWVPFGNEAVKDNHQVLNGIRGTQLYKALDHLRKLSGAPEPVRF